MWLVDAALVASLVASTPRPGRIIRYTGSRPPYPIPGATKKPHECRNCGAPVSRYECQCSYCKSEQ